MTQASRPIAAFAPVLLVISGLALPSAFGQEAGRKGIDLVLLVDVSRSMFDSPGNVPGQGNDPQRIRWEAVSLCLNLLSSEDQVYVLPFNSSVPAIHEENRTRIPGILAETFFNPKLERWKQKIRGFRHEERFKPEDQSEWNGDNGGTAILMALEKAKIALRDQPSPARKRYIVLLTDGQETGDVEKPVETGLRATPGDFRPMPDLEKNEGVKKWLTKLKNTFPSAAPVRIYTIGLGKVCDLKFLKYLAVDTGGHCYPVDSNGKLIETFRDLIWELRGCWTKSLPRRGPGPGEDLPPSNVEEDLLDKILDVGVLYYQDTKQPPRNFARIEGEADLSFVLKDRQGAGGLEAGSRTDEESNTHVYFDRPRADDNPRPFEKLVTGWKPSGLARRAHFSKRTTEPLFQVSELASGPVSRYQPLAIEVKMDMKLDFSPEQFKLEAAMESGEDDGGNVKTPVRLVDARRGIYRSEIDLAGLKSSGGESDDFTLVVTAEGKRSAVDYSLRGYTLTLPKVDIRVDNLFRLEEVGTIRVSNDEPPMPTRLRPVGKASAFRRSKRPMTFRVDVEEWPVDPSNRPVALVEVPGNPVTLVESPGGEVEGEFKLALNLDNLNKPDLPFGKYQGGRLRVSPVDPAYPKMAKPLLIPFEVSKNTIKIVFNLNGNVTLDYKGTGAVSSPVLELINPTKPTSNEAMIVDVSIPGLGFGPEELGLQAGTQPRSQSLRFSKLNEPFRIVFEPKAGRPPGFYALDLKVVPDKRKPYEFRNNLGQVRLNLNAPELIAGEIPPIPLQRGRPAASREIMVGLKGLAVLKREVTLQCVGPRSASSPPRAESPTFKFEGDAEPTSRIDFDVLDRLDLTASPTPDLRPMRLRLRAPEDLKCGRYTLIGGELSADRTQPRPVELTVLVNDLEVTDEQGRPVDDDLYFYQVKKVPLVRTFHVLAATGNLDWRQIKVDDFGPYRNPDDDRINPTVRLKRREVVEWKNPKDGRSGVEISLEYPEIEPSFEKFSGRIVIRCDQLELTKPLNAIVQTVELRKPARPPARK